MSKKGRRNKKDLFLTTKEQNFNFLIAIILFALFVLFIVAVFSKTSTIALTHSVKGEDLKTISKKQYEDIKQTSSKRGTIYDSSGNVLAVDIKEYKMKAVLNKDNKKYDESTYTFKPYYIENPIEDAQKIIDVLGYNNDNEAQQLIKKQLSQDPEEVYEVEFGKYGDDISLEQKNELENAGIKGLYFEEKANRYYPYGDLASYVIGYANQITDANGNINIVGELGVEKLLDSYLKGTDGEVLVNVDKQGVPLGNEQILKEKVDGTNVYLTLDSKIQAFVHDYMLKETKGHGFDLGLTVVMDANTGAILGAEKLPNFDPNLKDIDDYNDPFFELCYEPGSVIKTFIVAVAMKEGVWDGDKTFSSGKRVNSIWGKREDGNDNYVADWLYNDEGISWGTITFDQAFYFSSNVGMTYLLDYIGYDKWEKYMTNTFEFGKPIENEIFSSNSCDYSPDYNFETATTSFGQGMTVNVMQLLKAYTTFSGDGKMVNPYIIEKIEDPETKEVIYDGKSDAPKSWTEEKDGVKFDKEKNQYYKQIITEEQNDEILDLMEGVTYYNEGGDFLGTGYTYRKDLDYKIATKTGTSEIAINGSYANSVSMYSVVAMAPADDPEIIYYTAIYNPSEQYPQSYMQKYTSQIINSTLNYLNEENIKIKESEDIKNTIKIKDYVGKEIAKAEEELVEQNVKTKIYGSGSVKYQYPKYGQINENQTVYIIGDKLKKEDFIGLNQQEVENICFVTNQQCKFSGKGKVSKINQNSGEYIINLK